MEYNIGMSDRIVRLAIGAVLAIVGIASFADVLGLGMVVATVALVVGLVLLVTGALRVCPAYQLVGLDTLSRD